MAWFRLSNATMDEVDAERALALLELPVARERPPGFELVLATLEERSGDPRAAERRLQAIAEQEPENAFALNNLAYLQATSLGRPDEALPSIERAIRLADAQGIPPGAAASLWHTLAVVHRAAGNTEEAERALRRGIELSGYTSDLAIELAEVLIARDEPEEAAAVIGRLPSNTALSADQRARLEAIRAAIR